MIRLWLFLACLLALSAAVLLAPTWQTVAATAGGFAGAVLALALLKRWTP